MYEDWKCCLECVKAGTKLFIFEPGKCEKNSNIAKILYIKMS